MIYYQQLLDCLRSPRPREHAPQFHIQEDPLGWLILDGNRALGRIHSETHVFDLWAFSPFEADVGANNASFETSRTRDIHTMRNTLINLGKSGWPRSWHKQKTALEWTWLKKRGAELRVRVAGAFDRGEGASWILRVDYDPTGARYRYIWDIEAWTLDPDEFEGFNLMAPGALEDRTENRRWTHSLWESAEGGLRRIVHSNVLFQATDYGLAWRGGDGDAGPLRTRHAPYPRAWVGYAANETFNPAVLIHATNGPLLFATCSQLFDEHILWARAGQDQLDAKGYFHRRMRTELVNLPHKTAKSLLAKALDPVRLSKWRRRRAALPFHLDRVNSFSREAKVWAPEDCPLFIIPEEAERGIFWDRSVGRRDSRSIRLESDGARREIFPVGAVCKFPPGTRCRLEGWIRTRNARGAARLELAVFEYSYGNIHARGLSPAVKGTQPWTRVVAEVDLGEFACVLPTLVLEGPGIAWFDDLQLSAAP